MVDARRVGAQERIGRAVTPPDDPEFTRALQEAQVRIVDLHAELLVVYPAFQGSMAVPGMFLGHGLGCLVANGMTDDEIVTHALVIVAQIRQSLGQTVTAAPDDDASVH